MERKLLVSPPQNSGADTNCVISIWSLASLLAARYMNVAGLSSSPGLLQFPPRVQSGARSRTRNPGNIHSAPLESDIAVPMKVGEVGT
jgi:hypothetical protein